MRQYKPKEIKIFFLSQGWIEVRQTWSHCMLKHPAKDIVVPIPMHNKDIPIGTLLAILRQTGYSKSDFEGQL